MLASWSPVAIFTSSGPLSEVNTESCNSLEASSNASVMYIRSSCTVMLVLVYDVPFRISVICVVIGDFTLNMSSTPLCDRWNGNPAREFGLVRKMFMIVCRLDSLILSLIMFVNSVILVGFMLLVER